MKYEWNPADYSAHSSAQGRLAIEMLDALSLRGDEDVLDLGCGDGKITAALAARIPHGSVTGVDSSEGMIDLARERHGPDDPRLRFEIGDASALLYESAFDVVFSNSALHWILDHRPVVRGIARALKPGGSVALRMGGKGTAHQVVAAFDGLVREPMWQAHFTGFTFPYGFHAPEDYVVWLQDAGIEPTRVELVPRTAEHAPESFAGWIRTTWLPYTQRVPVDRRDEFIDAFLSRYLDENPDSTPAHYRVDMTRLDVEGRKSE